MVLRLRNPEYERGPRCGSVPSTVAGSLGAKSTRTPGPAPVP